MRKWLIFIVAIALVLVPSLALAQTNPTIENMTVQFWPEYDHPDMLVMYTFSLSEESSLPTDLKIRVPANANLTAVAKDVGGDTLINVPYDAPIEEGEWLTITITVADLETYRVEYYAPIEKNGATRQFDFVWQSDYAVQTLDVQFQQPPGASVLQLAPDLPSISTATNGITYYAGSFTDIGGANKAFTFSVSYDKENENLTVSGMPVQIGGPPVEEIEDSQNAVSFLTIVGGVGVVLVIGGIIYFVLSGRDSSKPKPRKRHSSGAAGSSQGAIYCHECGKRARPGDKFCRSCGAKLRL